MVAADACIVEMEGVWKGKVADVETKQIWHHQLGATWIFPLARRRVAQRSKVDPEIRCAGILPGV